MVLHCAGKPVRGATRVRAAAPEIGVSAVLAFDLGGTRLKSGAVGDDGAVLDLGATQVQGQPIVDLMLARADVLKVRHHAMACGVSVPGIVDGGRVVSLAGKHPGLEGLDIATTLTQTSSEAANHSLTLAAPGGTLSPNTAALSLSCAGAPAITTGCTSVGTSALSSPLIPFQLTG